MSESRRGLPSQPVHEGREAARYYARRRLNPYRGVVQFVDFGAADARSLDGVTWHLRADDGHGWVRPVGIWVEGEGLKAGVGQRYPELLAALADKPPLPFPVIDRAELWLLDKDTGQPLALLDATLPGQPRHGQAELSWIAFALTYRGFLSAALAELVPAGPNAAGHRECVERQVNGRAGPYAGAQWFLRHPDGSGAGLEGYRLAPGLPGRELAREDFPELLVSENWNSRLEKSVIRDYHAWQSPFLLCWPWLTDARRAELEGQAHARPQWLTQVYRLLPKVIDQPGLHAALVAARLERSTGNMETELFK